MSKQANPKVIGGFVIGAVVLVVAGILIFGSGQFMTEKLTYVLFFKGSLSGLNVGSPILFKGVKVGMVSDIVIRHDTRDHIFTNAVYVELEPDRVEVVGDLTKPRDPQAVVELLVERGLRGQLVMSSFVTGQRAIEFALLPDTPAVLKGADPRYPELPTMPSAFAELTKTIQNLPIEPLVNDIRHAIQGIDQLVRSPEIMKTIRDLDESLLAIKELTRKVDGQIEPLTTSFVETLAVARGALKQAQETLATVKGIIEEDSLLHYQVTNALGELSAALHSVRVLADYLQQHPEAVFSGKTTPGGT